MTRPSDAAIARAFMEREEIARRPGLVVVTHAAFCDLVNNRARAIDAEAEAEAKGDDSGEFGVGIKPNPKARYWQERAEFWRTQAVSLGWREKRDAEIEATPAAAVDAAMVERACKRYAFREDGALFPDAYGEDEVRAERVLMREFLTHVIGSATPAAAVPAAMTLHSSGGITNVSDYMIGGVVRTEHDQFASGWNQCRKAMLAASPADPLPASEVSS